MLILSDTLKTASASSAWAAQEANNNDRVVQETRLFLNWLANDDDRVAQETRLFLDLCFSNILPTKQSRFLQRIRNGKDVLDIEAAIYELIAHELIRRLGFSPEFDPRIIGLTPDMSVRILEAQFIADVFVTHNPQRTILESGPDFLFTRDAGDRAQKIAETIRIKSTQYAKTNLPLILFVFLGDHSVSIIDVEQALFGITVHEIELTETSLWGLREDERINGVFLSEEIGRPAHSNISAVIGCEWFDTLNRANPGKRLHCTVFHHWQPTIKLPVDVFGEFPQVIWYQGQPNSWKSSIIGRANVARLTDGKGIEFGIYTADNPW